jgi:glycerol-3-phosphate dehydrogenase (NAD(P)+)
MKVAVLGAGSWGTTLGILLHENEHEVSLWEFDPEQAAKLERDRVNEKFLPGVRIPMDLAIHSSLGDSLQGAELILFVVPSHVIRDVAKRAAGAVTGDTLVVSAVKGLEEKTMKRMSEVLDEELPVARSKIFSLSGPSHAEEVSRRMPTSVVVAGKENAAVERVQHAFIRPYFRVYASEDLIGVEIGVALKNIIAIAAGVCDGLGYGDNTKAALLTRGLVEIRRLGCALGARRETFAGLSGIGDLIATCLSRHSRNRYVGEKIGRGETLEEILEHMVMVAEGVRTTRAAIDLGRKTGIELPIIESTFGILFEGKDPREAINDLMSRPPQREMN